MDVSWMCNLLPDLLNIFWDPFIPFAEWSGSLCAHAGIIALKTVCSTQERGEKKRASSFKTSLRSSNNTTLIILLVIMGVSRLLTWKKREKEILLYLFLLCRTKVISSQDSNCPHILRDYHSIDVLCQYGEYQRRFNLFSQN